MLAVRTRFLQHARSRPVLALAALYVLYLAASFFLVDPLARRLLPWAGERMLASRLTAQEVTFNPFTLEVQVLGLVLAEADGRPLAGFDRLHANLDVTGLARWAWRLRSVELERPRAWVELRRDGSSNWSALATRLRERAGPPSQRMARVLVDRIRIADGDLAYTDAARAGEPVRATLHPLAIELAALSTLPEDRGDYLLAARLPDQGALVRWKGDIALNPLVSQGEVAVEGARIARLLPLLARGPVARAGGTLSANLHYRFALLRSPARQDVPALTLSHAQLQVRDFSLAPAAGGDPLLRVAETRVADVSLDTVRRELTVGSVSLDGGRFSASRDAHGTIDWQALFPPPGPGGAEAPAAAGAAPWKVAVRAIRLAAWSGRWSDASYERPLGATADGLGLEASLAGELGPAARIAIGPLQATGGTAVLTSGGEPVARLERSAVQDLHVQWPGPRVRIASIALGGASTAVLLDREQRLNWAAILRKRSDLPRPPEAATGTVPDLQVAHVTADGIALQFRDASTDSPVALDLAGGRIALSEVGLAPDRPIPLEAAFDVRQGGRITARGSVVPGAPSGQLQLALAGLALQPFAPYVNRFARLHLHAGTAGARGKLDFAPGKSGPRLDYRGGFAVDDLAITEEDSGEAFLGWKKLSSDTLRLTLGPDRLHIAELAAVNPFGRLIIFEDQTLNLQRIRRAPAAEPAAATSAPAASAAFPVVIERLRVSGANVEFADLSLRPQFGTRMHEVGGVVSGLASDPAATAQVELDGKVDDFGSARVRGTVQPFHATESTDLTLAFRNLEMNRLTPYSGKFAGRRIASGRLSVDLEYKIRQRQLAGTNRFVVNKLRLGEPVDSPEATRLPLDLAIALLEDADGVIDLDLPVSGSLDDPQFSYGAIVWKAIVNVLTKLVTAPFRALGALLGIDSGKMEAVAFDPGRSALLPPEQEKLKLLADAMAKRPALTLTIEPGYDPQADRRALQEAAMRARAAEAAGLRVAAGEDPGPVDVNNYKVQTWLEDGYVAQAGREAYDQLRASHRGQDAGAVQRMLDSETLERLGRRFRTREDGPPSAFHAELLERLTREVPVPDSALVALAQERARVLRAAIVEHGLSADRVQVGAATPQPAKDRQVPIGLALGAGKLGTGTDPVPTALPAPGPLLGPQASAAAIPGAAGESQRSATSQPRRTPHPSSR